MKMKVLVEVSAKHIHISQADYQFLFGCEEKFREFKQLSQSDFTTDKIVEAIGPKGSIKLRLLSPFREKTQVEISLTDCVAIGIDAPYEIDVTLNAAEIKLKGPCGEILRKAAIVSKRHLHCNPTEANKYQLIKGQQVKIIIDNDRGIVEFKNVTIKISDRYKLAIHLDTDEGNAAGIKGEVFGELYFN